MLHSFTNDAANPEAGVIFDAAGNLYGTTYYSDYGGTVFKLAPNADGSWTESVLHSFAEREGDGAGPYAGVIFGSSGNLYGTTTGGGTYGKEGYGVQANAQLKRKLDGKGAA